MAMFLDDIIIYPIKSLSGVRLKEAKVERRGLQYDRRWMLVDDHNQFITARRYPHLLLFEVKLIKEGIIIKEKNSGDTLHLPFEYTNGSTVKVTIWKDEVMAIAGKPEWGEWISERAGLSCRLVYMPENAIRPIKKQWAPNNEIVSFADGYPLLVVGASSLDKLNKKLSKPISIDRFRPNLIFSGGEPNEEFRWSKFMVGPNGFQGLKPCERCILTTIDPLTAERGKEPLFTLAKEKIDNRIVFGQHSSPVDTGTIHVGSKIDVISYKDSPYDPL